jgi:hypothetical protein
MECQVKQYGDSMVCVCGAKWDTNDINPPRCNYPVNKQVWHRLLRPTIKDNGLFISHDMPCAVCLSSPATYVYPLGAFAPCKD